MERFFLELDPPEAAMRSWPHVVVVGGGFAGLKVCHGLARQPVRVTLIDKRNFNLFQPLLYQVASGVGVRGRRGLYPAPDGGRCAQYPNPAG